MRTCCFQHFRVKNLTRCDRNGLAAKRKLKVHELVHERRTFSEIPGERVVRVDRVHLRQRRLGRINDLVCRPTGTQDVRGSPPFSCGIGHTTLRTNRWNILFHLYFPGKLRWSEDYFRQSHRLNATGNLGCGFHLGSLLVLRLTISGVCGRSSTTGSFCWLWRACRWAAS